MTNPYQDLADHCFWRLEVSDVKPKDVNPRVLAPFKLKKTTKVGTAGSCFAQHISRFLKLSGYNYFVTEKSPGVFRPEYAAKMNYGVYSARYGNIYTVRQLKQLLEECFCERITTEPVWKRADGYVDPLRPHVNATPSLTKADVTDARKDHIQAVRSLFMELDVFVFTLGLTEGWRSNSDGTVLPVVPGTSAGGEFDEEKYSHFNQSYPEVMSDLVAVRTILKSVNPEAKIILTVSPVPLIATREDQSVLVSTGYSKATLRAVAGDFAKTFDDVSYFPSYEIITGAFNRGAYFGPDLRTVREEGVRHAMRVFFEMFTDQSTPISRLKPNRSDLLHSVKPGQILLGQGDGDLATDDAPDQIDTLSQEPSFVDVVCEELLNDKV